VIDGIPGDSADAHHRGAIDLVTWSWGVANTTSVGATGASAGRPDFRPLRFVQRVDRATPHLIQTAATGRRIASAVLVCRRPGPQLLEYLKVTLNDVMVTGVQLSDPADGPPSADVSLAYARVAMEYRPPMPDGTVGNPVGTTWDLRMNRP
jgi:type VI secretion system secreted protein Hcp